MMAEIDRQMGSRSGTTGRTILVVDDSDDLCELYQTLLVHEGYEVTTASSAEEALQIVRTWRPCLVITDIFMPGIGGLELITRLRSDLAPPIPPIIAFSGVSEAKDEALKRGAARFETKPIGPEELLRIVEHAFVPERVWARPPNAVSERRVATRAIGEATLYKFIIETPDFFDKLGLTTRILARFFGQFSVLVFLLREGTLRLASSSDPHFPLDADATDILPLVNDVVESEGKLVITGSIPQFFLRKEALGDLRFLVAVPYSLDRAVVGALCLVDQIQHNFSTAAIGILEYMTSRGAAIVRGYAKAFDDSGLLDPGAFGAVLQASVVMALDAGYALGFTMLEVTEVPREWSLSELMSNLPAPSMTIGMLDQHHVAAFAVAESIGLVKERLACARSLLESRLVVNHTVELTYEDPVPRYELDVFVEHCGELLARAYAETRSFLAIDARRRELSAEGL
jgi:CheY-like chemotaxis protein